MRRHHLVLAILAPASLIASTPVTAKGCIRGAIVGGVAGHYAHHHAVAGAMAGCVAGHMYYKHKAKVAAAQKKPAPAPHH
jgi:outer membrane lipoprotein SlyB